MNNWAIEADKIQNNEMYYNLDSYAGELWLTAKQFEDNLQLNYQRYEKRIIDTRVHYEKKLESVK